MKPLPRHINIVLAGFMGTGKSAVGRLVAQKMGRAFVDLDAEIVQREGRGIPDIFRDSGEDHFRALERACVRDFAARRDLVIATGGGVVLNPENIRDFERTGLVICLQASPEQILRRVAGDIHRPLLQTDDKSGRIRELLTCRQPLYSEIRRQIFTDGLTPDRVAELVLALYESVTAPEPEPPRAPFDR